MYLVSLKLFIVRTILCTTYTTIICLFVILITQLFARFSQRRSSNHDCCSHATSHKADWILTTLASFVLPFYMHTSSIWWRFLKWNIRDFAFSRVLHILVYPFFSHACCWFTCSMYLIVFTYVVCTVNALTLVAFAFGAFSLYIHFTLMIFVLVAFAYCFHMI